ncbi:MAG: tetratricopeptide repeat protein [Planctomycetota bacterium]
MDESNPVDRRGQHSDEVPFERLTAEFERLRLLSTADREGELERLAVTEPGMTTELRALLACHREDSPVTSQWLFPADWVVEAMEGLGAEQSMLPVIAGYAVDRELGRGGMGVVYLARRAGADFEQTVAVKVLRAAAVDPAALARLRTERRILAGLRHPNIAAFLDGGATADGRPFVAMEFVDGVNLVEHCSRMRLGLRARLTMFVKVCRAVAHAHRALVVHRDLKPGNILVTAEDEPKLLDFGIAKLLGDRDDLADPAPDLTITGSFVLTPEYASPEQVLGLPITTATDVYSLGLILYELVSGVRAQPITVRTLDAILASVRDREPVPASATARAAGTLDSQSRSLRSDLDTVIAKAIRKEPERRYESATALAEDLQRCLEGLPIHARSDSFGYRARKFLVRYRYPIGAVALVMIALLALLVTTSQKNAEIARQRDEAITQRGAADELAKFLVELFETATPNANRSNGIRVREVLDVGARRIEERFGMSPRRRALVQIAMGRAYLALGMPREASALLTPAAAAVSNDPGNDELHRLAQFWTSVVAMQEGRMGDGEALMRLSMEPTADGHPVAPAERRERLLNLASWLRDAGRYDEAESCYREAQVIPPESKDHNPYRGSEPRVMFAVLERERGRPERSLEILLDLQRAAEADGSFAHPRSLGLHLELGRTYKELERFDEARVALDTYARFAREITGDKHPDVDAAIFELALLASDLGDFSEAERLFRDVLARDVARFGSDHPNVALDKGQVAMALANLARYSEAEQLYREALDIQRRHLEPTHPEIATTLGNLANLLHRAMRLEEAMVLGRERLELLTKAHRPDHPLVLTVRHQLAVFELDAQHLEQAESEFRAVLELRRATVGVHSDTAGTLLGLGVSLSRQQRFDEAIEVLSEATAMFDATLDQNHPTRARPRRSWAVALLRSGRAEAGVQHARQAATICRAAFGDGHPETLASDMVLADCLYAAGSRQDAVAIAKTVIEHGGDHPSAASLVQRARQLVAVVENAATGTAGK